MLYDLVHGPTAHKVLAQAVKSKHRAAAIPKILLNPPKPAPGLEHIYAAFWELVTEKPYEGAPIPASRMREWSERQEQDPEATADFAVIIRKMDLALMGWKRDKAGGKARGEPGKPLGRGT